MPAHKFSEKTLLRVKGIVEDCLREGHNPPELPSRGKGAHTAAVVRITDEFGCAEDTAWHWIARANKTPGFEVDYSVFRAYQYQAFKNHEHTNTALTRPDRKGKRIGVIGDAHDSPHLPVKDRFYWFGRWVADQGFDEVVQIGDIGSFDSLTRHAAPGTKTFADLPSYAQDLDSLRKALMAFNKGLGKWKGKKTITLGNHENRAKLYEDNHPQMVNLVHNALVMLLEEFGWTVIPYNEWYMVEGVALTHHVTNTVGRAYGGKTADQRTANDTVVSIIHGHTHQRQMYCGTKVGPLGSVDVVSVGCSLPWGLVEDYAKHGPSGWWWGVTAFHLVQGHIVSSAYTSMLDLEDKYSAGAC